MTDNESADAAAAPLRRQQRRVECNHGDDDPGDDNHGDNGDAGWPDQLVPDPQVRRELGDISSMCLWRWERDPELGFPPKIQIRGRNFRSRRLLEAWKVKILRQARTAAVRAIPSETGADHES